MTRLRSYLTDMYEQSENIMKATGRMSYEEFLEDALYSAGLIRFFGPVEMLPQPLDNARSPIGMDDAGLTRSREVAKGDS